MYESESMRVCSVLICCCHPCGSRMSNESHDVKLTIYQASGTQTSYHSLHLYGMTFVFLIRALPFLLLQDFRPFLLVEPRPPTIHCSCLACPSFCLIRALPFLLPRTSAAL